MRSTLAPSTKTRQEALDVAMTAVGSKWALHILEPLTRGRRRFSDILYEVPGLSPRLLTQRLRDLEEARLVARSEGPEGIRYEITDLGTHIAPTLEALMDFGERLQS